jgi:hypothetical protein
MLWLSGNVISELQGRRPSSGHEQSHSYAGCGFILTQLASSESDGTAHDGVEFLPHRDAFLVSLRATMAGEGRPMRLVILSIEFIFSRELRSPVTSSWEVGLRPYRSERLCSPLT